MEYILFYTRHRLGFTGKNVTVHIKLYGDKGERFEEIKAEMANEWGFEPTNPEVIGLLMAEYSRPTMTLSD